MGVGAGFCMYEYDVVVQEFTFAISSLNEFLLIHSLQKTKVHSKSITGNKAIRGIK